MGGTKTRTVRDVDLAGGRTWGSLESSSHAGRSFGRSGWVGWSWKRRIEGPVVQGCIKSGFKKLSKYKPKRRADPVLVV